MVTLRGVISLVCVAVLAPAVFTAQETPRKGRKSVAPVEADIMKYVKVGGRVVSSSGRYYRASDGRVREDVGSTSLVTDLKAHTVTRLNHETGQAHMITVPTATAPAMSPSTSLPIRLGHGLHEGQRITKSRMEGSDGGKLEVWTADDLGVAVMMRTETANVVSTRFLRNIALREPDSSVFAVPAGYVVSTVTLSNFPAVNAQAGKEAPSLLPQGGGPPGKARAR